MNHKYIILIIISPLILSLPVNESLYNILKEKAPYKIIDYNILFPNKEQNKQNPKSNNTIQQLNSTDKNKALRQLFNFNLALEIIETINDLINVAESLKSGDLDVASLTALTYRVAQWSLFKTVPKKYDFREKHKSYSLLFWQRQCESASAYAAALATSYRRAKNYNESRHLSGITILEHYGECTKINVVDAFSFINLYGLLEFPCRDQTYCTNCEYDDCISYDYRIDGFYSIKDTPYKCNELYGIKGKKNIKKEIIVNGPVVTSFKFYADFLYYTDGYYEHVAGEYIGSHEAVIIGWDDEGWIAQNSFGSFWGNDGFFKVKFENNIGFGEVAFASSGFVYFKIWLFAFLFIVIF